MFILFWLAPLLEKYDWKTNIATWLPTRLEDIATYHQNMSAKMQKIREILQQPSNRKQLQSVAAMLHSYRLPRAQYKFQPKSLELKCFSDLLKAVKDIVKDQPKRKCFISYTLPTDKPAKEELHSELKYMRDDLEEAGVEVMLDIVDMKGDIDRYMEEEILSCDKFLLVSLFLFFFFFFFFNFWKQIFIRQLAQRAEESGPENNIQKELKAALGKQEIDPTFIVPLIFEGPPRDVIPKSLHSIRLITHTFCIALFDLCNTSLLLISRNHKNMQKIWLRFIPLDSYPWFWIYIWIAYTKQCGMRTN